MALCDLHLLLSDVYIWIYCLFPAYLLRGIPGWQMQCQGHYMNKNLPALQVCQASHTGGNYCLRHWIIADYSYKTAGHNGMGPHWTLQHCVHGRFCHVPQYR